MALCAKDISVKDTKYTLFFVYASVKCLLLTGYTSSSQYQYCEFLRFAVSLLLIRLWKDKFNLIGLQVNKNPLENSSCWCDCPRMFHIILCNMT